MFTRHTRLLVLLCGGFFILGFVCGLFFLGFTSILIPSTHATGYSQSIHTELSPVLTAISCLTPSPSPTPTVGTTPVPPVLTVDSSALTFSSSQGNNPTPQHISITNRGGGQLDWTATVVNGTPSILSISPSKGSGLAGGATDFITVTAYTQGLAPGTYVSQVTISAVDHATSQPVAGSPSYVNIHITVLPSSILPSPTPSLTVSPSPSPSPSPTLCLTPSPTLSPTPSPTLSPTPSPTPTPETGLGLVQK